LAFSVAIAGASGYVGGELLRLIAMHPELQVKTLTARSNVGETVSALHPHLASFANLKFVDTTPESLAGHDIVFLALPHSKSAEVAAWLTEQTLVIDCGADFRLESSADWVKFYGGEHAGTWAYGMPELVIGQGQKQRTNLLGVRRIAVPGCNVTAITLALAPLLSAGISEPQELVSVLSVGTSGAGRAIKNSLLASEVLGAASAYGVGGVHRHTPEIEQNLNKAGAGKVSISFTPVLVPMSRGILAVNTAKLVGNHTTEDVLHALSAVYDQEEFIQVLPAGEYPSTGSVLGSNRVLIGAAVDQHTGRVCVVSAIDNLVKGTAGAAIQSMNIALGIQEQTGLTNNGIAP